jgi:hypothetical protein
MKHVNGDMEDLFRRASAKYPLRTDSADWDRLSSALDKDPGPPSDTDKDEKRRRRGIFWWWLLLPLAVGAGIYSWRATVRPSTHLSKAATQTQGAGVSTGATQKAGTQGAVAQGGGTEGTVAKAEAAQGAETQAGGSSVAGTQGAETLAQAGETGKAGADNGAGSVKGPKLAGSTAAGRRSTGPTVGRTNPTGPTARAGSASGGNVTSDDLFDAADKNMTRNKGRYGNSAAGKVGAARDGGEVAGAGDAGATGGAGVARDAGTSRLDLRRVPTAGSYSVVVDVKARAAGKDSSAKQAKKATAKSKSSHGYIGLSGAPDLSTVKMQATKGVGTTWGLILGYAFNSHWAVESGIYLDRKKYYTAGEYFKGETLPYNTNLQSVNGSCNMWEIPLNVRYNFNPGSKITWFATAGASSYFMTRQKYTSIVESGGVTWPNTWTDSAHDNYLFSIINLSVGFEQRIGKIGNLRIEPYLRIPLSGIGSGSLPIMSAGLNIGITHQLW